MRKEFELIKNKLWGEIWEDWSQFFDKKTKWNWIGFTFINFYIENEVYTGTAEIQIGLLGLNIRLCWISSTQKHEEFSDKIKKQLDTEILKAWTYSKWLIDFTRKKDDMIELYRTKKKFYELTGIDCKPVKVWLQYNQISNKK